MIISAFTMSDVSTRGGSINDLKSLVDGVSGSRPEYFQSPQRSSSLRVLTFGPPQTPTRPIIRLLRYRRFGQQTGQTVQVIRLEYRGRRLAQGGPALRRRDGPNQLVEFRLDFSSR
jgi:hypothetical protein